MDIGDSSSAEFTVNSESKTRVEANPVDIRGSSYTHCTVFSGN